MAVLRARGGRRGPGAPADGAGAAARPPARGPHAVRDDRGAAQAPRAGGPRPGRGRGRPVRPLARRLRDLEEGLAPARGRFLYVVAVADGEGLGERAAAVLEGAGVARGPGDLLVILRGFAEDDQPGRVMSSQPMATPARSSSRG